MEREIVFWDQDGAEFLTYTDKDEAIESILDKLDVTEGTLEICGFAPMEMTGLNLDAEIVAEHLLEGWDEEYGGEDNTDVSKEMKELTEKYVKEMSELYNVYRCEVVKKEKIDILKWIEKNKPDLLNK
jgi:hypothetical protein